MRLKNQRYPDPDQRLCRLCPNARNFLRTDQIMAGVLLVGILGLAIYQGMKEVERLIGRRWGISG